MLKKNVHIVCGVLCKDESASFGEGIMCFKCTPAKKMIAADHAEESAAVSTTVDQDVHEPKGGRTTTTITTTGNITSPTMETMPASTTSPGPSRSAQPQTYAQFAPPEDEQSWKLPINSSYKLYLDSIMGFFHDTSYSKSTVYSHAQLMELNPTVIK